MSNLNKTTLPCLTEGDNEFIQSAEYLVQLGWGQKISYNECGHAWYNQETNMWIHSSPKITHSGKVTKNSTLVGFAGTIYRFPDKSYPLSAKLLFNLYLQSHFSG